MRLTIQLVPRGLGANLDINREHRDISSIIEHPAGITTLDLSTGGQVMYAETGMIRYTVNSDELSSESIENTYLEALSTLRELTETNLGGTYRACLILAGENSISSYLENEDQISQFAKEHFGSPDPKYAELDSETIKISLSSDGRTIEV